MYKPIYNESGQVYYLLKLKYLHQNDMRNQKRKTKLMLKGVTWHK